MLSQHSASHLKLNSSEIDESTLEDILESFRKSEERAKMEQKEEEREKKTWKTALKYFAHGASFSILYLILLVAWSIGLLILVNIGHFLGLIIGLVILMWLIGGLNAILTAWLWFPVKTNFWALFSHGIVLFLALLVVNSIFIYLPVFAVPGVITHITAFIIGSFIDGYIAKKIAGVWRTTASSILKAAEIEWSERKL